MLKMQPDPRSKNDLFLRLLVDAKKVRKPLIVAELKRTADFQIWQTQRELKRESEVLDFERKLMAGVLPV